MSIWLEERVWERRLNRRDFLWLSSAALVGCAVNPVTGSRQLMLMSETQEIQIDKEQSPHQFSADYGAVQDDQLNAYLNDFGKNLAEKSHRQNVPYSFRAVNAAYVNAYAFPGGSIAATRGILVELTDESQLAGLMGHELGHVNARHAASKASWDMVSTVALAGTTALLAVTKYKEYASWAQVLGGVGAGALLASYSRDNEREADALGMEYMTKAGFNPSGMPNLMQVLVNQSKSKPSAFDRLFATHPMSDERLKTAQNQLDTKYADSKNLPVNKERYMDHTAKLRQIKPALEAMQRGEKYMTQEDFNNASTEFNKTLQLAPNDYAGLLMMAKCQMSLNKPTDAQRFTQQAQSIYPTEAQANHLNGVALMAQNKFDAAYSAFDQYEKKLPGNPNTVFLKGLTLESMQRKSAAAQEYNRYLQLSNQGDQAKYAAQRLQNWGLK